PPPARSTCSRSPSRPRRAPRRSRSSSSPTPPSRPTPARRSESCRRRRRGARARLACPRPPRSRLQRLFELDELAAEGLLHHAHPLRIALHHRLGHLLRLLAADVRRQRRNLRIRLDL